MINKVITGGILVAVMGGVPGATYLLTQKEKTTNEDKVEESSVPSTKAKDQEEHSSEGPRVATDADCIDSDEATCSDQSKKLQD